MNTEKRELPPNFRSLVVDFTNDLTRVFPENDIHWRRWGDPDITDEELMILFDHCCTYTSSSLNSTLLSLSLHRRHG